MKTGDPPQREPMHANPYEPPSSLDEPRLLAAAGRASLRWALGGLVIAPWFYGAALLAVDAVVNWHMWSNYQAPVVRWVLLNKLELHREVILWWLVHWLVLTPPAVVVLHRYRLLSPAAVGLLGVLMITAATLGFMAVVTLPENAANSLRDWRPLGGYAAQYFFTPWAAVCWFYAGWLRYGDRRAAAARGESH